MSRYDSYIVRNKSGQPLGFAEEREKTVSTLMSADSGYDWYIVTDKNQKPLIRKSSAKDSDY